MSNTKVWSAVCTNIPRTKKTPAVTVTALPVAVAPEFNVDAEAAAAPYEAEPPLTMASEEIVSPSAKTCVAKSVPAAMYFIYNVSGSSVVATS